VETIRPEKRATMEYSEKRSGVKNGSRRIQYSWRKTEAAGDSTGWRKVVCGLCSTWSDKV